MYKFTQKGSKMENKHLFNKTTLEQGNGGDKKTHHVGQNLTTKIGREKNRKNFNILQFYR